MEKTTPGGSPGSCRAVCNVAMMIAVVLFCVSTGLQAQFVYVANAESKDISVYGIGPTGLLTPIAPPVAVGMRPLSLVVDPTGEFVYVQGDGGVAVYRTAPTGALTFLNLMPNLLGPIGVNPAGKVLYVTGEAAMPPLPCPFSSIRAFSVGPAGTLTAIGSDVFTRQCSISKLMAVDPAGRFVYVVARDNSVLRNVDIIFAAAIGPSRTLTSIGETGGGIAITSIVIEPSGRFLYHANYGYRFGPFYPATAGLAARSINPNGDLPFIDSQPIALGITPGGIVVDPASRFLYVKDYGNPIPPRRAVATLQFKIGPTGSLTPIDPTIDAGEPLAVDPTGRFLYTVRADSNDVWAYSIGTTGALSIIGSTPSTGTGPKLIGISKCNAGPGISNVAANPRVLWPPNHKMVPVTIDYDVTGGCGTPSCTLAVSSNEPADATDWQFVDSHHVLLRAERSGNDDGRVYTVSVSCRGANGPAASEKSITVIVPHDSGKGK